MESRRSTCWWSISIRLKPRREAGVKLAEAIEQIDMGGSSMLRSASKNYQSVAVVVDPADYETGLGERRDRGG